MAEDEILLSDGAIHPLLHAKEVLSLQMDRYASMQKDFDKLQVKKSGTPIHQKNGLR